MWFRECAQLPLWYSLEVAVCDRHRVNEPWQKKTAIGSGGGFGTCIPTDSAPIRLGALLIWLQDAPTHRRRYGLATKKIDLLTP